jgi:hypothetical protein
MPLTFRPGHSPQAGAKPTRLSVRVRRPSLVGFQPPQQHTCRTRCLQYVKHNETIAAAEEKRKQNQDRARKKKPH